MGVKIKGGQGTLRTVRRNRCMLLQNAVPQANFLEITNDPTPWLSRQFVLQMCT